MDERQAAALAAHLVFFAAAAMFLAAQAVRPAHAPALSWSGWTAPADPPAEPCRAQAAGSGSYLERLGEVLGQVDGENLVGFDAPECRR